MGREPPPKTEPWPGMFWRSVLCESVRQQKDEAWADGRTVEDWVGTVANATVTTYTAKHERDGEYGGFFEAALLARALGSGWEFVIINAREAPARIVAVAGARGDGHNCLIGAAWRGNHWQRARFTEQGRQAVRAWQSRNQ